MQFYRVAASTHVANIVLLHCHSGGSGGLLLSSIFTAQCTLVQSAVLRSHVFRPSVRLSVCDVGGL